MSLGKLLKQKRLALFLSVSDIAQITKKSGRHIRYIERDDKKPSTELLFKLCKIYKCSVDEFKPFF